jgi:hypothetical protein
MSTP